MLADDVERWAADEPVTAWREPLWRRARRWARRNRTAVTAAAAAVMMAVVGLTAVLAVQTRANAALTVANTRLEISNQREVKANADLKAANERERARFALAQDAIRTFYTGVSEDLLLKQKEFDTLRTKLLRGAREFYQRLEGLLEGHKDRESRLALGRAYRDVGELTDLIGSREEALAAHQRALGLFEEVVARSARRAGAAIRGWQEFVRHRFPAVSDRRDPPRHWRPSTVLERPSGRWWKLAWPTTGSGASSPTPNIIYGVDRGRSGSLSRGTGHPTERARAILEALVAANPSVERFRLELASICDSLGLRLRDAGRTREASAAFDRARELCEALVAANPTDPKFAHELARTLGNWTSLSR